MRRMTTFGLPLTILACIAGCDASRAPSAPSTAPPPTPASPAASAGAAPAAAPSDSPASVRAPAAATARPAPAVQKAPSGLEYAVLKEGTGAPPPLGAKVKVHWTGRLKDGKVFGDTRAAGVPDDFRLTRSDLIDGLLEALQAMKPGEQRQLQVPSKLGYGAGGYRGVVPPNADLEIDVELVSYTSGGAR